MKRTSAPIALALVGTFGLAALAAAAACTTTPDPRAGSRRETSGSSGTTSSGGSSSGGIDAAIPEEVVSCGDAPVSTAPFTKQALLGAEADCAAWHACKFLNAATGLRKSVREHAAAPSDEKRASARAAWKAAMLEQSWMELFEFGPVASKVDDPYHGRGLKAFVHPWPQVSRCEVEKQVAGKEWQQQGIGAVLPSGRGLFALEYLLHYPGADTACLAGSPTGQTWATLAPTDLAKAKNDYAVAVADNVAALALEIRNVWQPDGENFKPKLLAADGYGNEQEALTIVGWSLFYVHDEVLDLKLASRAGVSATPPTPETPFANMEIENLRANVAAIRALFQGCGSNGEGLGFDDWLVAAGQGGLSNEIVTAIGELSSALNAVPSIEQATQPQARVLYDATKKLSDLFKARMFGSGSPLNLKLPASVASDTD